MSLLTNIFALKLVGHGGQTVVPIKSPAGALFNMNLKNSSIPSSISGFTRKPVSSVCVKLTQLSQRKHSALVGHTGDRRFFLSVSPFLPVNFSLSGGSCHGGGGLHSEFLLLFLLREDAESASPSIVLRCRNSPAD